MKAISSAAILTAFMLLAGSADAGQHQRRAGSRPAEGSRGQDNSGQDNNRAVPRQPDTPRAPAPRMEAPPAPAPPAPAPRAEAPRTDSRRGESPRRQDDAGRYNNRSSDNRGAVGRAVPRVEPYRGPDYRLDSRRSRGNRPIIVTPRYYSSGRYYSAPYRGYRPYYFRPRTRLNFGIYSGYSVPYAYVYPYPVQVYGYGRPLAPVTIGPGSPYYGGVSLEISPGYAEVFVDGAYAGWVEDFDGTLQPLTLAPGMHRIEVHAPGYEPFVFDVYVRAGEVVPYRGSLVPSRY
ncbi:MAG: PEGA domain-containing protein [Acidobacteria bacterium]|nr:PEGA domain-containing protein [Acidobacteriota bacterium]